MIKNIIFDFDGVIHDTFEIGYSTNKELDKSITKEEYKDFFNGNLYKHIKIKPKNYNLFFDIAEKKYKGLIIENEIKKELLKLKKKYRLFIITSTKESILKNYFHENNLKDLFNEIFGFETHTSKEEKFKILFKKYNISNEDCIFITDTLGDILEANKIGVKSIAVDYGFHDAERLKKGNPIKIISHIREIEGLL